MRILGLFGLFLLTACGNGQKNRVLPPKSKGSPRQPQGKPGLPQKGQPIQSETTWSESSPPFRLVLDPEGQVFVGAAGPLHAGLEVYEVLDASVLRRLLGTEGIDGRRLSGACARAIQRSPLSVKPELTMKVPASAPAGLRLIQFTRFSIVEPAKPSRLPLGQLGPGLYLVCLRSGGRVAMLPLGKGGPSVTALRSSGRTVLLLSQADRPLTGRRLLRLWPAGARSVETGKDGTALWTDPGGPQLIAARQGGGWGVAYLPPARNNRGEPHISLSRPAIFPGDSLAVRIRSERSASGPLWLVSEDNKRRLLGFVGVGPRQPTRFWWTSPPHLSSGQYQVVAALGDDTGGSISAPLTVHDGYRSSGVLQTQLVPAQPIAGTPVKLTVTLVRPAGPAREPIDLTITHWELGADNYRELDRREVRAAKGTVTVSLGKWAAGRQLITVSGRTPEGGHLLARRAAWVLSPAGHAIAPPSNRAVFPPGGPIRCTAVSRQIGEHRLQLQARVAGGGIKVVEVQHVRISGQAEAYFNATTPGQLRFRMIAPDGTTSTSPWFLVAGTATRSPIDAGVAVGTAMPGQGWPIIFGMTRRTCHLAVLEGGSGFRHMVLVGPGQAQVPGVVPPRSAGPVRVRLATDAGQWTTRLSVMPQAIQLRGDRLISPKGFSGLAIWQEAGHAPAGPDPPMYHPTLLEAASLTDSARLYPLRLRTTQVQGFQALTALSKKDYQRADKIARRILAAFPQHKLARNILRRARAGLASQGAAVDRSSPLARLKAAKLQPHWRELPLSAVIAELRDASGVMLELGVSRPHQSVTLSSNQAQDADTLLRTLLGRLGLAYRAIPGGFLIYEEVPPIKKRKAHEQTVAPSPGRFLTYRRLGEAPSAISLQRARELAIPPGGPWGLFLWPAGGWPRIHMSTTGTAPVDGVQPTFLRAGDRCKTTLAAPKSMVVIPDGITGSARSLVYAPTRTGSIAATLRFGARQRRVTVPVIPSRVASLRLEGRLSSGSVTLPGAGEMVLDSDRLALAIRWIRSIPAGMGPRAEAARQWCRVKATQLCLLHSLPKPDFSQVPLVSSAFRTPDSHGWGSGETSALVQHDLVRLANGGAAVPPAFVESVRPRLEAVLADENTHLSWRAAAFRALAAEKLRRPKLSEIKGFEINTASSIVLARLLEATLTLRDAKMAAQLAGRLSKMATRRNKRWHWTAPGHNPTAVTGEAAAALLAFDPGEPRALDAVTGLLDSKEDWGNHAMLPLLRAILMSVNRSAPRPPDQVTLGLGDQRRTLKLSPGCSVSLRIPHGKTVLRGSQDYPLSYSFLADGSNLPPARLPVSWSGKPRLGQTVKITIELTRNHPSRARQLVVPLLPGCRVRLARDEQRLVSREIGRLVLPLAPDDKRPLVLHLTPAIPGVFQLPGPYLVDLIGRTVAVASPRRVELGG